MGHGRWVSGEFVFVTEEKADSLSANCANPGDLIFTQRGTIGQVALVPDNGTMRYLISQSQMKLSVDPNKADALFLYYTFSGKQQQKYIQQNAIRTGVPHTNLGILKDTPVFLPPLDVQKSISDVIGKLDAKIELNNRINAELEAMAKLLYDYWFVQFDFPMTAEQATALGQTELAGQPYKTSGGKMVFNPILKRDIPEGWKVKELKSVAPVLTGKEDANHSTPDGKYPFFTCGDKPLKCDDYKFEGKAVLLAGNGNFGLKFHEGRFNAYQRTYVLIPHSEEHYGILWFAVQNSIQALTQSSSGSIIKFLRKGDIEDILIPLPQESHSVDFEAINRILLNVLNNQKQNQELTELRDWLLPMLMNGQVTVGE
jgi:type I restriction enzyme S subunit